MFDTIAALQRKSEYARKWIAFLVSAFIVFIIAAVWMASLRENAPVPTPPLDVVNEVKNDTTPLALLKNQWNELRALFSGEGVPASF